MDVKSLAVAPVSSDQSELKKLCLIRTAFFAGYDYLMVAEGIYVQRHLSADRRLGMLVLEFVDASRNKKSPTKKLFTVNALTLRYVEVTSIYRRIATLKYFHKRVDQVEPPK